MASFTDAIPQFNPYIQQLPVEAMVSVGMRSNSVTIKDYKESNLR
jgi:hypothetical protein